MKGFFLTGVFDFLEKQFDEQLVFDLMDKYGMPLGPKNAIQNLKQVSKHSWHSNPTILPKS